jgi:RNA polymerase sigma-70 factor (ECF subfamily)
MCQEQLSVSDHDHPERIEQLQQELQQCAPRLLAYVQRKLPAALRSLVDPQDVLQDTCVEAFRRVNDFEPVGDDARYRWLVTIARNRVAALARNYRTRRRSQGLVQLVELLKELAVYTRTPSRSAMSHELVVAVQQAIEALEPTYREAIRLRYIDGLSIDEIAGRMGRTKGSVNMLCNRAMKVLKERLDARALDSRTFLLKHTQTDAGPGV